MSPNQPKTPPRQIRIGDEWYDFDIDAKILGTERAGLIREFIAWVRREPGAEMPDRPAPYDYFTTETSDFYHSTGACFRWRGGRSTGDERHEIIPLTAAEVATIKQGPCGECVDPAPAAPAEEEH